MDYPDPLLSTRSELDFELNAPVLHGAAPAVKTRSILLIRGGGNKQRMVAMQAAMAAFAKKSWRMKKAPPATAGQG
jgi:hypothetical protein